MPYSGLPETSAETASVLVVDDDPLLRKALVGYLRSHNLNATEAATTAEAVHAVGSGKPDLLLLDIHLGEQNGLELLRDLRATSAVPVILMTGQLQDEVDRVIGLESGADDYLLKPFNMREMVARVRANLRRRDMDRHASRRRLGRRYVFRGWSFDQRARTLLKPDGSKVGLTKSEFTLLSTFVAKPGQSFTRHQLLQATRLHDEVVDRSIDVLILRLRRKLEDSNGRHRFIQTQRGTGYCFIADVSVE